METLDTDGNGFLSMEELNAAPGLRYAIQLIDIDKNEQLSRQEIYDHVKLYQEMRVGMAMFSCGVTLDGRPLVGAEVKFLPEPFLGDVIEPAFGTTGRSGQAQMVADGSDAPVPAARIGMYRVEITSPQAKIPVRYNTETELGVEISPVTDPYHPEETVFHLKSRN